MMLRLLIMSTRAPAAAHVTMQLLGRHGVIHRGDSDKQLQDVGNTQAT